MVPYYYIDGYSCIPDRLHDAVPSLKQPGAAIVGHVPAEEEKSRLGVEGYDLLVDLVKDLHVDALVRRVSVIVMHVKAAGYLP